MAHQQAHDEKLDALLAAAARVFAKRGYHETSMRDLARESGVSLSGGELAQNMVVLDCAQSVSRSRSVDSPGAEGSAD